MAMELATSAPPAADAALQDRALDDNLSDQGSEHGSDSSSSSEHDRLPPPKPGARCSAWCATKTAVFFLTFFSYVTFHACRKAFSAIKAEMADEQWMTSAIYPRSDQAQMYGLLDTVFMALYAIGLFISGVLSDSMDLRRIIAGGMWLTALLTVLFGVGAILDVHALSFYVMLWTVNGLVQSSGFPANVAVMGKWFSQNERGAVLGIWSGNACLGNMVGTMLVATAFELLPKEQAWKYAMVAVGVLIALHGTVIHFFLVPDPEQTPYRAISLEEAKQSVTEAKLAAVTEPPAQVKASSSMCGLVSIPATSKGISFWDAWCIPGVIPYSLSYACIKSVNYALFFWLPFYLTVSLGMDNSTANLYSMLFDIGQILGGSVSGFISDQMGVRSPVVVVSLVLSWVTIINFQDADYSVIGYFIFAAGFMIGGPASMISTAIAADLGSDKSIRGDEAALATVAGIVDGSGSIGAALVQYLVGYLADCHHEPADCDPNSANCLQTCSWGPVFTLLEWGTVLSAVCLLRLLYTEIIRMRTCRGPSTTSAAASP